MADWDDVRSALHARLAERLRRDAELAASLAELGALRDANNDDEHDPDGSPVSTEWSRLTGMRRENQVEIATTKAALGRIDGGAYGICSGCGQPIAARRLAARPTAERCIDCAQRPARR